MVYNVIPARISAILGVATVIPAQAGIFQQPFINNEAATQAVQNPKHRSRSKN
jgi:hypothetical protein